MIHYKVFAILAGLAITGCASIPEGAVVSGVVVVRVKSSNVYVIGKNVYPREAAVYWLDRLRETKRASRMEFLIDQPLLYRKVRPSDWLYDAFKGCSLAEANAFLLALDAHFGSPDAMFEFDPRTGVKGGKTPCSHYSFTMEM